MSVHVLDRNSVFTHRECTSMCTYSCRKKENLLIHIFLCVVFFFFWCFFLSDFQLALKHMWMYPYVYLITLFYFKYQLLNLECQWKHFLLSSVMVQKWLDCLLCTCWKMVAIGLTSFFPYVFHSQQTVASLRISLVFIFFFLLMHNKMQKISISYSQECLSFYRRWMSVAAIGKNMQ